MAFDTREHMLPPRGLSPMKLDPSGTKDMSMQLQQLKLMREKFEYEKQRNIEDDKLRQLEEAGRMSREALAAQREQEQRQAAIAASELTHQRGVEAKNLEQRQAAYDALGKRADTADYEGMEIDATRLNELGGLAERAGEDENGFPAWRIELDAKAARQRDADQEAQAGAQVSENPYDGVQTPGDVDEPLVQSLDRLNALGYDSLGLRGNMAGTGVGEGQPLSTEDAFHSAQSAARAPDEAPPPAAAEPEPTPWQPGDLAPDDPAPAPDDPGATPYDTAGEADAAANYAEPGRSTPMAPPPGLEPSIFQATGRPARGPDRPDIMGSVPMNTIDTGAMQDQRKQRLGPVMDGMVKGMPGAYQAQTRANADAALAMGLPADKAVDQALKLNAPANSALASELDAERKAKAAELKAIEDAKLDPKGEQVLIKYGRDAGWKSYTTLKVGSSVSTMKMAAQVDRMLSNKDSADDDKAVNLMMSLAEQSGHQSDADALRMTGGVISTWDKVKEWMHEQVKGGYGDKIKASMKDFARDVREKERTKVFSWMDSTSRTMEGANHPLVAKGYKEVLDSMPADLLDEYAGDSEEHPEGGEPDSAAGATVRTPRDANGRDDADPTTGYRPPIRGAADGPAIDNVEEAIPKGSRIAYEHKNPGNLVYDKDNPAGAEPGEDKFDKDGKKAGKWARFPTVQAGFDALRGYIARHEDLTIRAFLTKYAPPSDDNDTEKYISDAARELKAEPDDTVYDVDPYDMMRFIVRHESSTNMPYQYDSVDAKNAKLEGQPVPSRTGVTTVERPAATAEPTGGGADDDKFEGID
jgi:hypothetical protein